MVQSEDSPNDSKHLSNRGSEAFMKWVTPPTQPGKQR